MTDLTDERLAEMRREAEALLEPDAQSYVHERIQARSVLTLAAEVERLQERVRVLEAALRARGKSVLSAALQQQEPEA